MKKKSTTYEQEKVRTVPCEKDLECQNNPWPKLFVFLMVLFLFFRILGSFCKSGTSQGIDNSRTDSGFHQILVLFRDIPHDDGNGLSIGWWILL